MIFLLFSLNANAQKEAKDYFNSYDNAFKNENWSEGIVQMNGCINEINKFAKQYKDPNALLALAYFCRGDCYFNLKQYRAALSDYNTSYQSNRKKAESYNYHYWAGLCKYNLNEYCNAMSDFDTYLIQKDSAQDTYSYKALCRIQFKEYEKALEEANLSIIRNFYDVFRYRVRGLVYYYLGDYQKSLEDYNKVLELKPSSITDIKYSYDLSLAMLNPASAYHYYLRGLRYSEDDTLYREAINEFNIAINMKSDSAAYFIKRADSYYYLKEYATAKSDYEKALEIEPSNSSAFNGLGNIAHKNKNYDDAIYYYTKAVDNFSGEPRTKAIFLCNRGDTYFIQDKNTEALNSYKLALNCDENFSRPNQCLGNYYDYEYKYTVAILYYTNAIKFDCKNSYIYEKRGDAYYSNHQFGNAINDYNKVIEIDGKAGYISRGIINAMMAKYDDAMNDLNKALGFNPSDNNALIIMGCLYAITDRCSELPSYFNLSIEKIEGNSTYFSNIAFGYNLCGQYNEAINNANIAISLNSNSMFGYLNRAYANGKLGNIQDALNDYGKYYSEYTEGDIFYWFRGVTYYDMGKFEDALKDWEKALRLNSYLDIKLRNLMNEATSKSK